MSLPPRLPGGLPFLGHAWEFRRDPIGLLQRGRDRFGEIFSFLLAGKRVHVLTGPQASGVFFKAPEDQLSAKEAYRFTVPIFGKGVAYDVATEVFDEQMGLIFPALRDSRLQAYARAMAEESELYFQSWGDRGQVDLYHVMNELTVYIASRCLIGHEFRQHLSAEFAALYPDLEAGFSLLAFLNPNLPLPSFRRRDRARRRLGEMIAGIIAQRKGGGTGGEDFLETLLSARYANGQPLSEEIVTGLLVTLIFAGQANSAVMAAWAGLLLLQNPQFLTAAVAEQEGLFGGEASEMTLEAVRKMVVLARIVKEAERLRPPLIMLMRTIRGDFKFHGHTMPAGDLALVSPGVSHRIPEVFRNPDSYDPDRFGPGREEDRKALYSLIGFGGGKHHCVGQTFAYQEIRVIWSVLLRTFDLELAQAEYPPDYSSFVAGPRKPCLVNYRRKAGRGAPDAASVSARA